jgi:hypothetical protein
MRCRDHSTNQQQTLSLTLCSESLACGTAWTSTVEERRAGQVKEQPGMASGMLLTREPLTSAAVL